jgi:hypothetical protein
MEKKELNLESPPFLSSLHQLYVIVGSMRSSSESENSPSVQNFPQPLFVDVNTPIF